MQEFLAFIDKVRAQTRASSHSALAMCPVVFPIPSRQARLSTELTPLTNYTRPLSPSLQCVQNNLHIQPGKKRTAKKRSSRSTRRGKWKELGESGTRAPINYLPFVHLSHSLSFLVMGHMSIFCICAANWPILWHLFIALRAGKSRRGSSRGRHISFALIRIMLGQITRTVRQGGGSEVTL